MNNSDDFDLPPEHVRRTVKNIDEPKAEVPTAKNRGSLSDTPYEVGYGKPPQHTRFQPGRPSPNPRGRPRKDKAFQQVLEEALKRKVSVQTGGRTRRMDVNEVTVHQLLKNAMLGKEWAIKLVIGLNEKMAPFRDKAISAEELEQKRQLSAKLVGLLDAEAARKKNLARRDTSYQKPKAGDNSEDGSTPSDSG